MTSLRIACRGLTRRFNDDVAVDGVDLEVRAGEIHAIVGLNGAGKTTLMRLLLGMLTPDDGHAEILEHPLSSATPAVWSGVGHLIETPFAYPELPIVENLTVAAMLHGVESSEIATVVGRLVEEFGLSRWAGKRARALSSGNRQRLGLASALIHRPSLLILDEPANSLDPAGLVFTRDLLRSFVGDGGAVFLSSHHLDELARVADRISVLHRGRIVGSLDPSGVDLERTFFALVYEADLASEGGAA